VKARKDADVVPDSVDDGPGIDGPEARLEPKDASVELHDYLDRHTRTLEGMLANLGSIPPDTWRNLAKQQPLTARRLAEAARKVADFLDGVPEDGTTTG
jgi:hypothetical protein